jgi:hypothetical protein
MVVDRLHDGRPAGAADTVRDALAVLLAPLHAFDLVADDLEHLADLLAG